MSNEWAVNPARPTSPGQVEDQHGDQDEDRAEEGVEQELDRRVLAVRAAPDGDQEVHRQQHHLEEHVEQEQVERDEDAHHARGQQQVEREYPLTCLSMFHEARHASTLTRPGQHDQAQADPVERRGSIGC